MKQVMKRAGAGTPSANRITLLRGLRDDGTAQLKTVFLENLNSPFGMALVGNDFYVANTDAVVRYPYTPGQTRIEGAGTKVVDLPGRAAQPPLDQEPDRQPRRQQALRHGRLEQQRRRARHGRRGRPRGDLGDRPRPPARAASSPRACAIRTAWPGAQARRRAGAVDRGQRARRDRQRPGARLPDLGARRRLLRLAVQLLRTERRRPGASRRTRSWSPRRSRPTTPSGPHTASLGLVSSEGARLPPSLRERHLRRPARLLEPPAAQRLQGDLRALRRRQAARRCRSTC